uniref:Glucuronosyltransferase n=1 Tax=Panagrolaimus sp. PS1159 TaxID=55785 RepID=A0AC35F8Y9_9BILA
MLLFFSFFLLTENAKILIYNPEYEFSKSHRNFHGSLADLLADAGHEVIMYQPLTDNDTSFTGSNNPKVKIISKKFNTKVALNYKEFQKNVWNFDPANFGTGMLSTITKIFDEICEKQLRDSKILLELKSENYDLGFAEYWESCGFGIFEQIGLEKRIKIFAAMIHDQLPG